MKTCIKLLAAWALSLAFTNSPAATNVPMNSSGALDFGHWHFEWYIGDSNNEGLVIKNVTWKGVSVLHKGSMPAIRVKYRGDAQDVESGCGPYLDRISNEAIDDALDDGLNNPYSGAIPTRVVLRFFDNDERIEIGVFAILGDYDLFQSWNFTKSGKLIPKLHSRGWSCCEDGIENTHKHHVYWRLDFDVEDKNNSIWLHRKRVNGETHSRYEKEQNTWKKESDISLRWTIKKPGAERYVAVQYPNQGPRDKTGKPWFHFGAHDAYVRRYHQEENKGWQYCGDTKFDCLIQLGYGWAVPPGPENVVNKDIVFWIVGHIKHEWTQSDVSNPHWHPTGPVITPSW